MPALTLNPVIPKPCTAQLKRKENLHHLTRLKQEQNYLWSPNRNFQ